jgi:glycosyltransferase involved in cell wall biosynthesis
MTDTAPHAPPKVSVLIATYNRARMLGAAIDSVLAQSYQDFELIVVDDGSTDGTRELVARRYGSAVRYIYQENRGRSEARNTGIKAARGDFFAFLDSDDAWLPEKLARQVRLLEQRPQIGIVSPLHRSSTKQQAQRRGHPTAPAISRARPEARLHLRCDGRRVRHVHVDGHGAPVLRGASRFL